MKILVGYDGSKVADAALELAKKRAMDSGAEVVVAMSLMVPDTVAEKEAEKKIADTKQVFKDEKISVSTLVLVRGLYPGEDLVTFAKENNIDEIIIGIRKRSKVGKMLFGSTAQHVILHAHCPVVVIK